MLCICLYVHVLGLSLPYVLRGHEAYNHIELVGVMQLHGLWCQHHDFVAVFNPRVSTFFVSLHSTTVDRWTIPAGSQFALTASGGSWGGTTMLLQLVCGSKCLMA